MSGLTVADFHFSENSPLFMERFAILVRAGMIVGSISLSSFVGIMSLSHVFVGISLISLSRLFSVVAANDLSVGVSLGGILYWGISLNWCLMPSSFCLKNLAKPSASSSLLCASGIGFGLLLPVISLTSLNSFFVLLELALIIL